MDWSFGRQTDVEKVLCLNRAKIRDADDIIEISGKSDNELTFVYYSNKELKISPGTTVIILDDKFNYSFSHTGEVSDVDVKRFRPGQEDAFKDFIPQEAVIPTKSFRTEFSITHSRLIREEDDDYVLDNFIYSLPFVKDFDDPKRDFPKLRWISFEDYETIVEKKIFISRTAFGYLINALPFENRWQLATVIRQRFQKEGAYISDYAIALKIVTDYIRQSVYRTGELLIESYSIAKTLPIDNFPADKVGSSYPSEFSGDIRPAVDNLRNQQTRFQELFNYEQKENFLSNVFNEIALNSDSEDRFNKRFQEVPWPINLL